MRIWTIFLNKQSISDFNTNISSYPSLTDPGKRLSGTDMTLYSISSRYMYSRTWSFWDFLIGFGLGHNRSFELEQSLSLLVKYLDRNSTNPSGLTYPLNLTHPLSLGTEWYTQESWVKIENQSWGHSKAKISVNKFQLRRFKNCSIFDGSRSIVDFIIQKAI